MATSLNAVTFMGKNYSTMQNVVKSRKSYIENRCLTSQRK